MYVCVCGKKWTLIIVFCSKLQRTRAQVYPLKIKPCPIATPRQVAHVGSGQHFGPPGCFKCALQIKLDWMFTSYNYFNQRVIILSQVALAEILDTPCSVLKSPIHFSHKLCYVTHSWSSSTAWISMKLFWLNYQYKRSTIAKISGPWIKVQIHKNVRK